MTKLASKSPSQRLKALIHIAKKELGLDDETYRASLAQVTGKDSTVAMTIPEMERVLAAMKRQGFRPKRSRLYSPASRHKVEKTEADKIRALWIDLYKGGHIGDGSEAALGRWLTRQTAKWNDGQGIASPDWLPGALAWRVIEALKQWSKRVEH